MLRQEELAFIKAMSALRKAMVASNKKKKNFPASRGATAMVASKKTKKTIVPASRRAATTTAHPSGRPQIIQPTVPRTSQPAAALHLVTLSAKSPKYGTPRANKLPRAADNSALPRAGWPTLQW
jgi:hypothetical protein